MFDAEQTLCDESTVGSSSGYSMRKAVITPSRIGTMLPGSPPDCNVAEQRAAPDLPVEEGYVIAHFDPAWSADCDESGR